MAAEFTIFGVEGMRVRAVRSVAGACRDRRAFPSVEELAEEADSALDGAAADGADPESPLVGAMRRAAQKTAAREVVLALPLSRLLVRIVRVPVDSREEAGMRAAEALARISPFPDEELAVGAEVVQENETELVVLAAALPEASAAEIGAALDAAGVRVTRVDVTALGRLRAFWPRIAPDGAPGRRLVLMNLDGADWDVVVLDDGAPAFLRGFGALARAEDIVRETTLSLLQCERVADLRETVIFSAGPVDETLVRDMAAFAPVRVETVTGDGAFAGVEGVALRTAEGAALDATPVAWASALDETRFRRRLFGACAAFGAACLAVLAVFYGVPFAQGRLAAGVKAETNRMGKAYREVCDMRDRVELVRRYSDHPHGALETLKALSDLLPDGVTLTSFRFERGKGVSVAGEAGHPKDVTDYKDALTKAVLEPSGAGEDGGEDGDAPEPVFAKTSLNGPSLSRNVQKFTIEAEFPQADAEGDSGP